MAATTHIYLDDQACDVSQNNVIALTLQVNNIAELRDRQSNFTNRFNIPPTKKNIDIVEHANTSQSLTNKPYQINNARLYQNGLPIIEQGKATIQEVTESNISINIWDGNIAFFDLIEGKKLSDLDLSEFDHLWDEPAATNSATNDYNGGYTYPILDYGVLLTTGNAFDIEYQYPAIFTRMLIDKIASEVGYSFEGLIFNDDFFNKLALPFANDEFKNGDRFLQENVFLFEQINDDSLNVTVTTTGNPPVTQTHELTWAEKTFSSTQTTKIRLSGEVTTNIDIVRSVVNKIVDVQYSIVFKKNAVEFYRQEIDNSGEVDIITGEETFNSLDVLTIEIELFYGEVPPVRPSTVDITATFLLNNAIVEPFEFNTNIQVGGTVNLESNLPDMSQKDFLKSIANIFGIIFNTNSNKKVVTWTQYKELYYNRGRAIDWSDKLDRRSFDKTTRLGNYAQVNNMLYKEDDEVTEGLGDGTITINDTTLDAETDLFELEFAASESQSDYFDFNLTCVKIPKLTGSPIALETSTEPRLIFVEQEGGTGSPSTDIWFNGSSSSTLVTQYNVAKFIDTEYVQNLAFDNNLKLNYYQELERKTLTNAQKWEVNCKLTALDILNIDLTIPVYIDKYNAYFYINKIKEFKGSDTLTTVDLIKL